MGENQLLEELRELDSVDSARRGNPSDTFFIYVKENHSRDVTRAINAHDYMVLDISSSNGDNDHFIYAVPRDSYLAKQ